MEESNGETFSEEPLKGPPQTRPIRSAGRAVVGILFLALSLRSFLFSKNDGFIDLAYSLMVLIGISVIYFLLHRLIESGKIRLNGFNGALLANGIVGLVMGIGYAMQNLPIFLGSTLYIGVTLLISSYRRYTGCEVISLPAVLTKKHTSLPCIVFTPIDKWENAHSRD